MDPEQIAAFIQQQVAAALAQAPAAAAAAAAPPRPRPAKPDCFSATTADSDVDLWLFSLDEYFEACNLNDDARKIAEAATYLRGPALTWWRTVRQGPPEQQIHNWELFKQGLRHTFKPINSVKLARDKLAALKQNVTVRAYATAFRNITLDIPGITDEEKLDKFLRGLKQRTREQVELKEPANFDEAVRLAERYDTLAWRYGSLSSPPTFQPDVAPMELGAVTYASPASDGHSHKVPLTPALRDQLLREGKCFYCREAGHRLKDCPKRRKQGFLNAIRTPHIPRVDPTTGFTYEPYSISSA